MDFFRYPHTPHIAWLGDGQPRDDKLLAPEEVADLLSGDLVVEEKIDGANLGFSTNEDGGLLCQNRGAYIRREVAHEQFRTLWPWLATRSDALVDALWPDLMLFGEWCAAVHSVEYDALPDWFLGFDVYDRAEGRFFDTARRDGLLAALGMMPVPRIAAGRHTVETLKALIGDSRVGAVPMEGMVVRRDANGWNSMRAKLVRPAFTQAIDEHWSRRALRRNALARGAH
jgi:hypothetical protein